MKKELLEQLEKDYSVRIFPCRIDDAFWQNNSYIVPLYHSREIGFEEIEIPNDNEILKFWLDDDLSEVIRDDLTVSETFTDQEIDEFYEMFEKDYSREDFEMLPANEFYDLFAERSGFEDANKVINEAIDEDQVMEYVDKYRDDALMWNTLYQARSNQIDVGLAHECNLCVVTFDGTDYASIGGAGMDLSPKLDAYQFMRNGTMPRDSMWLKDGENDRKYCTDLVGDRIAAIITEKLENGREFIELMEVE
jgi:hypothetical protein